MTANAVIITLPEEVIFFRAQSPGAKGSESSVDGVSACAEEDFSGRWDSLGTFPPVVPQPYHTDLQHQSHLGSFQKRQDSKALHTLRFRFSRFRLETQNLYFYNVPPFPPLPDFHCHCIIFKKLKT